LLMLPFRLLGIAVEGVFSLIKSIIMLPVRLIQRVWIIPRKIEILIIYLFTGFRKLIHYCLGRKLFRIATASW
jgi:hypothetical protein